VIYSMTAFAREEVPCASQQLVCEMRSINHRYAEISVHLPDALRAFEMAIRDKIRQRLKRGKIDCSIRLQQAGDRSASSLVLNKEMLTALNAASDEIAAHLPSVAMMTVMDVLRFPGVMEVGTLEMADAEHTLLSLVEKTVGTLMHNRSVEGNALLPFFQDKLQQIQAHLQTVRAELPAILRATREKLLQRFTEASLQLNNERLEQEMVLFAQKIDVIEEIERAESHVQAISGQLQAGGVIGRQLDFLLQELNREANTLGSKSAHLIMTQAALQMKVLIEQIREQVQNIE